MSEDTLMVSEQFYSVQGEGPTAGVPAVFLRLTGCNLTCPGWGSTGCDTTSVWSKGNKFTFEEIFNLWRQQGWITKLVGKHAHLIITGGEPFLQQKKVWEFILWLTNECRYGERQIKPVIEWETNGTIVPEEPSRNGTKKDHSDGLRLEIQYNCSPKLSSAGNPMNKALIPEALEWFASSTLETMTNVQSASYFKFVIQDAERDLEEINHLVKMYRINPRRVYLMPEGAERTSLWNNFARVMDLCKDTGYRFSPRLHITAWNQAVGV